MATTASKGHTQKNARARRRQNKARERQKRRLWLSGLAIFVVGGLVAAIVWAVLTPEPGEAAIGLGNDHITEAQMGQFVYNTSPPTSGPHLGSLAAWGVHDTPIPNELQVHNLEDGAVIIHYNCPDGCPDLVAQLTEIVEPYHEGLILEPYPNMDTRIALTAWERIDQFEDFDRERIERFITAYLGDDHHR